MIMGLLGCIAFLFAQLAFLHYVDQRVAAMPRLAELPVDDMSVPSDTLEAA